MTWTCLKCGHENESEVPDFGRDAVCEKCGAIHETDWDYTDAYDGCYSSWVVGLQEETSE